MLSVLIVCQQVDDLLLRTIKSVEALKPQILVDISPDSKEALGVRKNRLIDRVAYEWVLVLDTDEVVSHDLQKEIKYIIRNSPINIHGYKIPYQNYAFGSVIRFGGEQFTKTRLFRKQHGKLAPYYVHEHVVISDSVELLKGVIFHYSYRTLAQIIKKFTLYSWYMAREMSKNGEIVTFANLFLYGPHMVWARVIKDEGWRDGWRGIVIALCFGYMETLTYWLLLWRKLFG